MQNKKGEANWKQKSRTPRKLSQLLENEELSERTAMYWALHIKGRNMIDNV